MKKQEIFNSIREEGYIPFIVSIDDVPMDAVFMGINAICPHGKAVWFKTYQLLGKEEWDDEWECMENECMEYECKLYCLICGSTKDNSLIVCSNCHGKLPELSEQERIKYHEKQIDMLIDTCCPSCGSYWVMAK